MAQRIAEGIELTTLNRLHRMPALEALRHTAANLGQLVDVMRRYSAPPTGLNREPLRFKIGEAAKQLGRSVTWVREAALELGLGRDPGSDEMRTFGQEDLAKMRRAKGLGPLPPKDSCPFVLVVSNQKGGVGKTTTSNGLVQDLASRGYRILVVDMDPQASMTNSWLLRDRETGKLTNEGDANLGYEDTAATVMTGEILSFDSIIRQTHWANVDIVPSHPDLVEGAMTLVSLFGEKQQSAAFWIAFRDACRRLSTERYDIVVIDTAPALGLDSIEIALAADGLLIPVPPRNLDIESAKSFIRTLSSWLDILSRRYTVELKWFRFLMTQHQKASQSEMRNQVLMEDYLGPLLLESFVPRMEALERASAASPSVYEVPPSMPKSAGSSARNARAGLRNVHTEIFDLIAQTWTSEEA